MTALDWFGMVAIIGGTVAPVFHIAGFDQKRAGKIILAILPDLLGAVKHAAAVPPEDDEGAP
jgi:hypothetical protein